MSIYYSEYKDNPFSEDMVLRQPPCIINCFAVFYMLQMLDAEFSIDDKHINSHLVQRYLDDFNAYKNCFNRKFADAIYDYTVMAVAGELRHFNTHATSKLPGYRFVGIPAYNKIVPEYRNRTLFKQDIEGQGSSTRTEIYKDIIYTPESLLEIASYCFDEKNFYWDNNFGGTPWKNIADAGMLYSKNLDIFIDHTADLEHNSGNYFDKVSTGIFSSFSMGSLLKLLNNKANAKSVYELLKQTEVYMDSKTLQFINRFMELHYMYGKYKNTAEKNFDWEFRKLMDLEALLSKIMRCPTQKRENDINLFFLFNYRKKKFGNIKLTKKNIIVLPNTIYYENLPEYWK